MYRRWAESKGFKAHVLDFLDGEEAGIKSVTVQIDGENAYGYLRSEHGCTVWCVYLPLTPRASARLPLCPATLCPILREGQILR